MHLIFIVALEILIIQMAGPKKKGKKRRFIKCVDVLVVCFYAYNFREIFRVDVNFY